MLDSEHWEKEGEYLEGAAKALGMSVSNYLRLLVHTDIALKLTHNKHQHLFKSLLPGNPTWKRNEDKRKKKQ